MQPQLWKHETRRLPSCPSSPRPGMKMTPALPVSRPLSFSPFLFYFANPFSMLCKRTALSRRPSPQPLAMPGIFCWQHKEIPHPVDLMWTQPSLLHLSIVEIYTHMELNPHTCLFTSSAFCVFCHCHQELHLLKHLRAPGFTKDLFLAEFPVFLSFLCRKLSLGCYPLLYSIPAGLFGMRGNYKSNASE